MNKHRNKQRSRVFALAMLALFLGGTASPSVAAQRWYKVNGKPATKAEYDAIMLVQDASRLTEVNRIDEAGEILKKALALAPRLEVARTNYGFVMMRQGKYGQAIEMLRGVVGDNPQMAVAWLTLGGCYQTVGRIPEAIDAYKRHMRLSPNSPNTAKYNELIEKLQQEASSSAAAIAESPPDADTYLQSGSPLGVKWPDDLIPIAVYIPKTSDVDRYKPFYRNILIGAFTKWAAASHGKISFVFVDQPEQAKLICEWSSDPNKVKFQGEGGHTVFNYRNQDIFNANILLLTIDPSSTIPLMPVLLAKVCLHEVGHALGLIGHSSNPNDIMFFSMDLSKHVGSISERDSKTLQALYAERQAQPAAGQQPATNNQMVPAAQQ